MNYMNLIEELRNKEIKINENRKTYVEYNNKIIILPSVTEIVNLYPDDDLQKFIDSVGEDAAKRISKYNADTGSIMHLFLEKFFNAIKDGKDKKSAYKYSTETVLESLNEQIKNKLIKEKNVLDARDYFISIIKSNLENDLKVVLEQELKLDSKIYLFKGKFDISYIDLNNSLVIGDFKKSNTMIKEDSPKIIKYKMQLSAYMWLYKENFNKDVDYSKLWIGLSEKLGRNDKFLLNVQEVILSKNEFDTYFNEFLNLLDLYFKNAIQ